VLEALERNDISRLPGGIFGRAFVRSYALEVGLDPEVTIQNFIAQFPHDAVVVGHPTTQTEDREALESDRRTASTFLRLIAVSIPVAAAVLYLGSAGRFSPGEQPPDMAGTTSTSASPGQPAPAADRLTIALVATGPCWLSATVDGETRP
jgi:cytoskeletal protein RodZ